MRRLLPIRALLGAATLALAACSSSHAPTDAVAIDIASLKEVPMVQPADIQFVALKIPDGALKLDEITKAKIAGGKIFVCGMRGSTLVAYDMQGNPTPVGHQGRGEKEYLQVSSFDVDENGFVHLVDAEARKIIIYDSSFGFIRKIDFPFGIDDIKCLPGGNYLLALAGWNEGENADNQVVVCDAEFNILSVEKLYDHSVINNNFWLGFPTLTALGDKVFYMRAPDETVWAFSAVDGKFVEKYYLDLGADAIPVEHRGNLEPFYDRLKGYKYFTGFCAVTDHYIYGVIFDKNSDYKNYIIDREKGEIATSQYDNPGNLAGNFRAISSGKIISEIMDVELYGREMGVNIDSVSHVITLRSIL